MKRTISHDKTNWVKSFFFLIGILPVVLLSFLWKDFDLAGTAALSMLLIVLAHMVTCLWYATRFKYISFDKQYMYTNNGSEVKAIQLEQIVSVTPVRWAIPLGRGKSFPVHVSYKENGKTKFVYYLSMAVSLEGTADDIPGLDSFKNAITEAKMQ